MKKSLPSAMAGTLLLALLNVQPLLAADFGASGPPVSAADGQYWTGSDPAPFDWSGFYAGVYGGLTADGRLPSPFNGDGRALTGGVLAGARYQHGIVVLGAEVAGAYSHNLDHDIGAGQLRQNWSGSAQATAGIAMDKFLVMGSAGYGIARLEGLSDTSTDQKVVGGLVFGGAVEYALDDSLSLRIGYEQARFDDVEATVGGVTATRDLVNHTVKAGINFRF